MLFYSIRNLGLFLPWLSLYCCAEGEEHGGKGKGCIRNASFPNFSWGMRMPLLCIGSMPLKISRLSTSLLNVLDLQCMKLA